MGSIFHAGRNSFTKHTCEDIRFQIRSVSASCMERVSSAAEISSVLPKFQSMAKAFLEIPLSELFEFIASEIALSDDILILRVFNVISVILNVLVCSEGAAVKRAVCWKLDPYDKF